MEPVKLKRLRILKDAEEPLLPVQVTVNGEEIRKSKDGVFSNEQAHSGPFDLNNYKEWDFGKLNMLFGTDSQPFVIFVSEEGRATTLGIKCNMSLRNHQSVVRLDEDRLIFAGGVNYLFNHVTSKAYEYNIRTSKFTKIGNLLNRRFFAQIALVRGRLLVIGGRDYGSDDVSILRSCEEYNFGTKAWEETGYLNFARCNFASLVFQNDLYVFSGLARTSQLHNSIERFNFSKSVWEVLGLEVTQDMLGNLGFHKGDEILIFGGTRTWGAGSLIRLNMKYGADLGEPFYKRLSSKNALAKPIVLEKHVLVLGGFFPNVLMIDRESLKVIDDPGKVNAYKEVVGEIDKACMQSFRLTKCSFVLPLRNAGGRL